MLKLAKIVAGHQSVLPLARETVEGVAAALKEAQMKPGAQYLAELRLLHVEAGYEVEAWLKRAFDLCRKSLDRERGPTKRAKEVKVETEAVDKTKKWSSRKSMPQYGGLVFLWACLWMLRERIWSHEDQGRHLVGGRRMGDHKPAHLEERPTSSWSQTDAELLPRACSIWQRLW